MTDMNKNSSFEASVLGMQANLMSFAMKLTLNKDKANDLVQDTTLKALDNESKFAENSNFKGWMLTIMRNIFINNYRKASRENTTVDIREDYSTINMAVDAADTTPDGAYTCNEISAIIATFPESYREPFNMHVAGYKYEEISEKLSMPMGTVKSRIFFTRRRLREILKDYI